VIQAVDAEDWERVVQLDEEAYTLVQPIVDQIEGRIQVRSDALAELRDQVDTFTTLSWLSIALALPAFVAAIAVAAWIVARQIHGPVIRMTDELPRIEEERFDPAGLSPLAERRDEVGYLAREYLQMASAVLGRRAGLQQEADEIRARIR
jgi:nitrogen fixation/metabolism regulation signal transduction histidine kinase